MRGFVRVLAVELRKTRMLLAVSLIVAPAALVVLATGSAEPGEDFAMFYANNVLMYAWLFYPILAGILAALVCRVDHLAGGWKLMLALPVRRSQVYLAKYVVVIALLALAQLVLLGFIAASAAWSGVGGIYDWSAVLSGSLFGWLAVLPLAALQLWASTRLKAFGGPLALNVILALPALFAVQSERFGPWYPWAQPALAMISPVRDGFLPVSLETLIYVIGAGFVVWMAAGLTHFARADAPA